MSRPTEAELNRALKHATDMRESGSDEYYLAKSLLNLNYRIGLLEDVMTKAKRYLHSGQGSHEHTTLLKAIEKAEAAENYLGEEPRGFID